MLSPADRSTLLTIARESIVAATAGRKLPPLDADALAGPLREHRASFVTLTSDGGLRGCIGGLEPLMPLALDVQEHAIGAALDDPRFPPVVPAEVPRLHIEISVLTVPALVPHRTPEELLAALRPHVDGVVLRQGYRRATFLPQVWEKVPDPVTFLEMLSEKMGASLDAWRSPSVEVLRYEVEEFSE
ncbi:MAG: AmmeMemoRadiSam system protein A [Chloroflexi bacterium]|nr:AmmeMemoRadiSam system protein A [Chloroflexota bacterium]MBI4315617.1 AmmeMemoRadiSam system protein A [Chloroflexota bacterium]